MTSVVHLMQGEYRAWNATIHDHLLVHSRSQHLFSWFLWPGLSDAAISRGECVIRHVCACARATLTRDRGVARCAKERNGT